jgi:hypothetical protein
MRDGLDVVGEVLSVHGLAGADAMWCSKDLQPPRAGDETSTGLRILTARRADKSADRVRAISHLQAQLLEYFPALERAFDYSRSKAALLLLTKHRTPDGIRRTGQVRLHAWLKRHGTRSSAAVAQAAVDAAKSQHTTVPAQHLGELIVAALAREIMTLNKELADLVALISEKVTEHRQLRPCSACPASDPSSPPSSSAPPAKTSPSFKPQTGSPASPASPRCPGTPGRITGNHHRPRRYDRRLLRVFYLRQVFRQGLCQGATVRGEVPGCPGCGCGIAVEKASFQGAAGPFHCQGSDHVGIDFQAQRRVQGGGGVPGAEGGKDALDPAGEQAQEHVGVGVGKGGALQIVCEL